MNMVNKLTFFFLFLFASCACADIPSADDEFKVLDNDDIHKYISHSYIDLDGGEWLINISPDFINAFSGNSCLLSGSLTIIKEENENTKWTKVMGVAFSDLSLDASANLTYLVIGLGGNLRIRFSYDVGQCKNIDSDTYAPQNKVEFILENFGK